jgi:hypothetical protein
MFSILDPINDPPLQSLLKLDLQTKLAIDMAEDEDRRGGDSSNIIHNEADPNEERIQLADEREDKTNFGNTDILTIRLLIEFHIANIDRTISF